MVDKEEDLTKAKFNHHKLKEYLEGINASLPDIDPKVYTSCMLEFVKIFNIIGSALSIAFSDITSKSAIIRKNFAANPDFKGGIISFIKMEEGLKVQRCNGENNKKEAPSKEWMEYTSTTRTVLRLMWFFDYVSTFLGNLAADKKESVSGCSKDAYDKALGPHHPFPVRAGAKLAMTACPNRVKLFKGMFGDLEDEKIYEFLNLVVELVDPIRKNLWKFYEENNLTELP